MKFGVVVFPGSNCDQDIIHVCREVMQCETRVLWHKDTSLQDLTTEDCIMIPGGFSYGDYLRCGAIARFSPIMEKVIEDISFTAPEVTEKKIVIDAKYVRSRLENFVKDVDLSRYIL